MTPSRLQEDPKETPKEATDKTAKDILRRPPKRPRVDPLRDLQIDPK